MIEIGGLESTPKAPAKVRGGTRKPPVLTLPSMGMLLQIIGFPVHIIHHKKKDESRGSRNEDSSTDGAELIRYEEIGTLVGAQLNPSYQRVVPGSIFYSVTLDTGWTAPSLIDLAQGDEISAYGYRTGQKFGSTLVLTAQGHRVDLSRNPTV